VFQFLRLFIPSNFISNEKKLKGRILPKRFSVHFLEKFAVIFFFLKRKKIFWNLKNKFLMKKIRNPEQI